MVYNKLNKLSYVGAPNRVRRLVGFAGVAGEKCGRIGLFKSDELISLFASAGVESMLLESGVSASTLTLVLLQMEQEILVF